MDETDGLDRLQDGLPKLKCVRLNGTADMPGDGKIPTNSDNTEEEDPEDSDQSPTPWERPHTRGSSDVPDSDSEMGTESTMQDANEDESVEEGENVGADDDSITSWSDHD